jgi:predicted transcriptional regulator of viral defense system
MMSSGISGQSRRELAAVTGRGPRLVHVDETARALGIDRVEAAKKLARWAEQGWLRRVRRGLYIPVPVDADQPNLWSEDPLVLADEVWAPCYFTGWTAANHWGLTEQIFRTTVVRTASRVRRIHERLLEHEYLLSHVNEHALGWGLRKVWRQERAVRMADPARVIIDSLDDSRLSGGIRHVSEMLVAYLAEHEPQLLVDYGDRAGNRTVFKRLGYLAAICAPAEAVLLVEEARRRLPSGVTLLDPSAPPRGQLDHQWRLRINVHVEPSSTS